MKKSKVGKQTNNEEMSRFRIDTVGLLDFEIHPASHPKAKGEFS